MDRTPEAEEAMWESAMLTDARKVMLEVFDLMGELEVDSAAWQLLYSTTGVLRTITMGQVPLERIKAPKPDVRDVI